VEPARAEQVSDRVAEPWPIEAFDLELAGLGMFPPAGPPRVIWVGVARGAEALVALERVIQQRVGPLGFEPESRPFHPHLTLGRVRKPVRPRARDLVCRDIATGTIGRCRVTEVVLYQSELSREGPTYTVLAHGPLATSAEFSTGGRS
jgi:2'-5' RNA ligase